MTDHEEKVRQLLRHERNVLEARREVIAENIARLRKDRDRIDAVLAAMERGEIDVDAVVSRIEEGK